jgi:hypothetical protein
VAQLMSEIMSVLHRRRGPVRSRRRRDPSTGTR